MSNYKFHMSKSEYKDFFDQNNSFTSGMEMQKMDGIFVSWATNPEKIQAMLPPCFEMAVPVVTTYIVNIDATNFAPIYNEAALIVPVVYKGVPGGYLQSLLLTGLGEPMATYMGREVVGLPKKKADAISITRHGDIVKAYVEKDGVRFIDIEMEIGQYNTKDGEQVFGGNASGAKVSNMLTYYLTYSIEHDKEGKMRFDNAKLLKSTNDTSYKVWLPATANVTLKPTINAPWADLEVIQVLGGGYSNHAMDNFHTFFVEDLDADSIMPYLLKARYDSAVFNQPNIKY